MLGKGRLLHEVIAGRAVRQPEAPALVADGLRPMSYAAPYDGDLVLFRAAENRAGRHDGWADLVRGKLEIHELPGRHTDILSEPRVRVLARELGAVLSAKQALYVCGGTTETLKVVELPPRRGQARLIPAAEMAISADGTTVGH